VFQDIKAKEVTNIPISTTVVPQVLQDPRGLQDLLDQSTTNNTPQEARSRKIAPCILPMDQKLIGMHHEKLSFLSTILPPNYDIFKIFF